MKFRYAKKLRVGDEVILKEDGQVYKIFSIPTVIRNLIIFKLITNNGYEEFTHLEIK